jgi:hypothetical protein
MTYIDDTTPVKLPSKKELERLERFYKKQAERTIKDIETAYKRAAKSKLIFKTVLTPRILLQHAGLSPKYFKLTYHDTMRVV